MHSIRKLIQYLIVLFGKSYSPETNIIKQILKQHYHYELSDRWFCCVDIEKRQDCSTVEDYLLILSGYNTRQVPLLFVKGRIVGGYSQIYRLHREDRLKRLFTKYNLESDSEDDDDDVRETRLRRHEMVVRVEELDDTEVMVKVADWVQLDEQPIVDFDAFKRSDSVTSDTSELADLKRASFVLKLERRCRPQGPNRATVSLTDVDPEWMYVGAIPQPHKDQAVRVSASDVVGGGGARPTKSSAPHVGAHRSEAEMSNVGTEASGSKIKEEEPVEGLATEESLDHVRSKESLASSKKN